MPTITFGRSNSVLAESGKIYRANGSDNSPNREERWIEVLVDLPFEILGNRSEGEEKEEKLYTYQLPLGWDVQPGDILSVPFGAQQLKAIAIRPLSELPPTLKPERVKPIDDIVSKGFLTPTYQELLNRVATYYQTELIKVIRTALPPGLLRRSQRRIRLIANAIPPEADKFLTTTARQILQILQDSKMGDCAWNYLKDRVPGAHRGVTDLLQQQWVISYLEPPASPKAKLQQAIRLKVNPFLVAASDRHRQILLTLRDCGGEMWVSEFIKFCRTTAETLKKLEQKGYVSIEAQENLRLEQGIAQTPDTPKALNQHQIAALAVINRLSGFNQVLLHGVTGSGKTEVYLQAIGPILERGQSVLVLVPEIGLTPQLTDRFRARFGDRVCVYHSALSEGERYDTWRYVSQGIPQVVIGTRSAIFTPLPRLGMIILDEEHDSSFKQNERPPLYHARTVAQWRAELEDCPLILGSATPSLETWVEVTNQEVRLRSLPPHLTHYLSLPQRIHDRPMPPIEVVDMRQELQQGNRSIFSTSLQQALQQLQERKQQGILFIHRRGHSTFVSCRSCGYVMECPNCDVSLSFHHTHERATELLRCHYCNYLKLQPPRCPKCYSPYFKFFGSGTQKVAQELQRYFPQLRWIRFDSDTTRNKDTHRKLLTQFIKGEADLLIGTQMLTKGLDIAQVTLVGVVSADGLLHLSEYRVNERAFQLLTQVAGRAGRGSDPGRAIIQTYTPEHPVIRAVRNHRYSSFIQAELQQRYELNYPPYRRLILLHLSGQDADEVEATARLFASILESNEKKYYELLGPAPAPIMRVANQYRWQILLKFPLKRSVDLPIFDRLRDRCPRSVSLMIDVDPLNFS